MNIVRKIRLSKLDCYQIKESEKELFDFVETSLLRLKCVRLTEYPEYDMYFNSEGKNIFQHDLKNNYLYINYNLIWLKFETDFGYNYDKIKEIVKNVAEQGYKLKNTIPFEEYPDIFEVVEQSYNLQNVID